MQACRRFSTPANALVRTSYAHRALALPRSAQANTHDLRPLLIQTLNLRFSSTQTQSALQPTSSSVNAPLSTLPAPLELPTKDRDASTFSYLLKTGKAYLSFYKTGLKNVYHNFISTRPLQTRIDKLGSGRITPLVAHNAITRSEFQHIMRSRHDTRRIPVFAVVFLIFGEFSPLILPFISSVVPWNCRIPSQLHGDRVKLEKRREEAFRTFAAPEGVEMRDVYALGRSELLHVSNVLGITSTKWPGALGLPPTAWVRLRVRRRVEYLEIDDTLLERGGGVDALDGGEELRMAAVERGLDVVDKSDRVLREELKHWFAAKERAGGITPALWLTRPSKWLPPAEPSSAAVEAGKRRVYNP
ncbi:uncharacterized protein H6S33_013037 [Morchella sextelata]|uniref:uncharacterized protein n=1 Tax=Morchella sextelata TaxID=1174677 RepID=UPI001D054F67|nr:uncharacterized protein H6S33_013037 [Morchella sextelata]KAH0609551.1 hypothetical protein H6S33_013037 [Morchella sextelata]